VDFVTAPGVTSENVYREGGPTLVVTSKAVLGWDNTAKEWVLQDVHPGSSVDDVKKNTGFDLRVLPAMRITPPPTAEELYTLRTVVREKLARFYPDFVRQKIRHAQPP
jgi:glutaconate CoA-transferase subunit B